MANREALEKKLILLRELAKRKKERNAIYEPFRQFIGRYAILIGGSGSGKSYAAADKVIDRIVQEDDHRFLCVRAEGKQVSKSQFPLLVSRIKKRYDINDFQINRSQGNESITYKPNGNEIIFSGLDDVEKLKSIFDITSIWIEEADQVLYEDVRELDRRLRGYQGVNQNRTPKYMQIMFTFNPTSVLSYLKREYFDRKAPNQIMLHGEIPFTDCKPLKAFNGDVNITNTLIIHSTYRDNKFMDKQYHEVMERLRETDPGEYNVYGLGQWGVTGGTYFDKEKVNERIMLNIQPIKVGYFDFEYKDQLIVDDSIKWVNDPDGYIRIYEEPKIGYPYVYGGDTAGDGSDWNTGIMTNNVNDEEVATVRINYDEDLYARQVYCLGRYYNNALLSIETNFSTHPQKELERLGYTNFYVREETPDAYTNKMQKKYGFNTNKATRPLALGYLRTKVRENPQTIKDKDELYEMTVFVKNEKGKPEAMQGEHDDMIMAHAINCYSKHQQRNYVYIEPEQKGPEHFAFRGTEHRVDSYTAGEPTMHYLGGW